ncbi:MAG: AtpZ/AtpI family protein [Desulfovibrionaceae bacterium]
MFLHNGKHKEVWDAILSAGTIGLNLVSATIIGAVIGHFLDQWLGTKPWLFLFWLIMGIIAGFRMVIQDMNRIARRDEAVRKGLDPDNLPDEPGGDELPNTTKTKAGRAGKREKPEK